MRALRLRPPRSLDILPGLGPGSGDFSSAAVHPRRHFLTRSRIALALLVALFALAVGTRTAGAAAEVHRLNLVLSAIPTEITGGDVTEQIDATNRFLESFGLKGLERIKQG